MGYKEARLRKTLSILIVKHRARVKRAVKRGPERMVGKTGDELGVCGLLEIKE